MRAHIHAPRHLGDKVADKLAAIVGSWRFVLGQNWLVIAWVTWNSMPGVPHFDPFPFILLNLLFSWQASNTGPVLQMTGNRQAAKDRIRDDHEAITVDVMAADHKLLMQINDQQLQILQTLQATKKKP